MTDETPNNASTPDASAEAQTAPIEVPAPEQPTTSQANVESTPTGRQGIPAWAVISGAAAAGLVVVAGLGGYAIGQANADPIRDLPILEAGGPMQPGAPTPPGAQDDQGGDRSDGQGEGRGDGRGDHHDGWGQGRDDEQWEQDGSRDGMRPQDDFGGQGPMAMPDGVMPQGIAPEDLQQLLDLLMQANGGRMQFQGPMDGQMNGPMGGDSGGQFDGQWGSPHGYSQGS